jgi:hypothetical protein
MNKVSGFRFQVSGVRKKQVSGINRFQVSRFRCQSPGSKVQRSKVQRLDNRRYGSDLVSKDEGEQLSVRNQQPACDELSRVEARTLEPRTSEP